jgi:hypothetical protein
MLETCGKKKIGTLAEIDTRKFAVGEPDVFYAGVFHCGQRQVTAFEMAVQEIMVADITFDKIAIDKAAINKFAFRQFFSVINMAECFVFVKNRLHRIVL